MELKPCPFCGNEYPIIHPVKVSVTRSIYEIYCPGCDAYFRLGAGEHQYIEERIVRAWNRRPVGKES